jgi:hypothetical protein
MAVKDLNVVCTGVKDGRLGFRMVKRSATTDELRSTMLKIPERLAAIADPRVREALAAITRISISRTP